jgi:taurine--2-oxoglutarate transaminase
MDQWVKRDKESLVQIYDTQPVVFTGAEGMYLIDNNGKRYLDFSAQFSSCSLGHGNAELIDAVAKQMQKLVSVTSMFVTEERVLLAEKLKSIAPAGLEKVIFGCTGSDANELALKLAKIYKGGGRVISFRRGFHGSTAASAAATGKTETIQDNPSISELLPHGFLHSAPPYCYRCDFDKLPESCGYYCLKALEQTMMHEGGEKIAAIITEPIFAAGGVIVPPKGFFEGLRALCDAYGVLLIFDEVVTGIGRTGSMFACQGYGVTPDILVTGKALTGGYVPGSAVLMKKEIGEAADKLTLHGHTHSCYPAMCASALKNLEIIAREKLVENSASAGAYLNERLLELQQKYEEIGDVRGRGLLQGFELVKNRKTKEAHYALGSLLFEKMLEEGLVTELESRKNLQNVIIVLHPPLITSRKDVDNASELIDSAMAYCLKRV